MEEYLYPHFYSIENTHWWFAARQNILWNYMEAKLHFPAGAKLLDVGCGTGAILDMFSRKYETYGQDVSPQAVAFCRQRGLTNLYCGTLDGFPSSYGRFDIVTMLDVLEHIEDDLAVLRQVRTLLNEGGRLVITVPAFPALWGAHDVVTHHKRRYVRRTLRAVVEQGGFAVEEIGYFNFFLFPVAWVRRLAARFSSASHVSDLEVPARPVNALLRGVFETEKYLLPRMTFPFGLSLICVARKREG